MTRPSPPAEARAVTEFWRDAGPKMWFAKDGDFDSRFRERFRAQHEAAADRELTVEKVGTLHFNVKDELKRTWARTTRSQHKDKGGEGPHTPQLTGKYAKA